MEQTVFPVGKVGAREKKMAAPRDPAPEAGRLWAPPLVLGPPRQNAREKPTTPNQPGWGFRTP